MAQTEITEKPFDADLKQILGKVANTIRGLSIDAVLKADSGHPGLPLGCAEIGAYLYGYFLKQNPKDSHWMNRDRFVLSAGHGCMLLYSCLHLAGFNLPLEELKNFRQLHSHTPGHPESHETDGVESTTGPLGQGVGNACGMALGMKILAEKFNNKDQKIFDNKVVFLAGDGCIMEGVNHEVASLAGFLKLNNLIGIYDSNKVCLDGPTAECLAEDTHVRYVAYGWDVIEIDGHDFDEIHAAFTQARKKQEKPLLIIAHTIIGKGSPKAGSNKVHGSPLNEEEVKETKNFFGIPVEPSFYIPQQVTSFFEQKLQSDKALQARWEELFAKWSNEFPEKRKEFDCMAQNIVPKDLEEKLNQLTIKSPIAGRKASQEVINFIADLLPQIYGGSADLSVSDLTMLKKFPLIAPGAYSGRNIKFGVREFGMATMATGLRQTAMIQPYIGTFLTFSDYMRNAIRLAALSQTKVIYQFTHDSVFLGEDGPTHQPIEQLSSLRAIPNLHVIRPGSTHEVKMGWLAALNYNGPTAFALSRQNMADVPETVVPYEQGVGRGGYIVKKESAQPLFTLIATGSELALAMSVAQELEKLSKPCRVVSMPCTEIFDKQSPEYKQSVLGGAIGKRVSIEAAVDMCWYKYIGLDGIAICMETFGASAPASQVAKEFGFTVEAILERLL